MITNKQLHLTQSEICTLKDILVLGLKENSYKTEILERLECWVNKYSFFTNEDIELIKRLVFKFNLKVNEDIPITVISDNLFSIDCYLENIYWAENSQNIFNKISEIQWK